MLFRSENYKPLYKYWLGFFITSIAYWNLPYLFEAIPCVEHLRRCASTPAASLRFRLLQL